MLKSHSGRNFTIVLQGLAEIGYLSAWRILDAQYDGLAQRRKRVFIVGRLRNMAGLERAESGRDLPGLAGLPAEVLFESESLSWDSAPRREAGKGVTAPVKASFPSRRGGGSWPIAEEFVVWDNAQGDPNAEIGDVAYSVNPQMNQGIAGTLTERMQGQSNQWAPINEADNLIVQHALSGNNQRNDPNGEHFVVAFNWQSGGDVRLGISEEQAGALQANQVPAVLAVSENQRGEVRLTPYTRQLSAGGGKPGQGYPAALTQYGVRRLTPTECEKLQGFPLGWTAVNGQSDSARYRQLGNAVWPQSAEWIGRQILATMKGS